MTVKRILTLAFLIGSTQLHGNESGACSAPPVYKGYGTLTLSVPELAAGLARCLGKTAEKCLAGKAAVTCADGRQVLADAEAFEKCVREEMGDEKADDCELAHLDTLVGYEIPVVITGK